jgi:hypothetical protein
MWQARPGFSGLGAMRQRRRMLRGLGATNTIFSTAIPGFAPTSILTSRSLGPIAAPAWQRAQIGTAIPGATPFQVAQIAAQNAATPQLTPGNGATTNTGAGSTAANVTGSPVPVGYPTNQIYVAPGGAFWEFNGTTWQNVGTPYNVGGVTSTTPSTTTAVPYSPVPAGYPTTSLYTYTDGSVWQYSAGAGGWIEIQGPTSGISATGAITPYSPVPAGYPTNMLYTYTDGSVWQYNAASGGWIEIQGPSSTTSALSTSGVPVGTSTAAPYTDAQGNVWTYNPTTGQWAISSVASTSGYQSILDWLSTSTLISGVPNWIIAAGAGFAAIKLMNPSRGR